MTKLWQHVRVLVTSCCCDGSDKPHIRSHSGTSASSCTTVSHYTFQWAVGRHIHPKSAPSRANLNPILYMILWAQASLYSKRRLDRFIRFCKAYRVVQHAHRRTDTQITLTSSFCSNRPIYGMHALPISTVDFTVQSNLRILTPS